MRAPRGGVVRRVPWLGRPGAVSDRPSWGRGAEPGIVVHGYVGARRSPSRTPRPLPAPRHPARRGPRPCGPLDVAASRERLAGFRDMLAPHGRPNVPLAEGGLTSTAVSRPCRTAGPPPGRGRRVRSQRPHGPRRLPSAAPAQPPGARGRGRRRLRRRRYRCHLPFSTGHVRRPVEERAAELTRCSTSTPTAHSQTRRRSSPSPDWWVASRRDGAVRSIPDASRDVSRVRLGADRAVGSRMRRTRHTRHRRRDQCRVVDRAANPTDFGFSC